ncbi:hypothetical protein DSLASN_48160 [Desulfoluna limicola]|uniref:Uncharacterized protein n=1 Tax=Desulfoluna limicola TaxID=2810562 RepID=A0ABN6F9T9_9BACT|nr:hypothetical protein DSLASN_48160 [Desulfoluna limicola]
MAPTYSKAGEDGTDEVVEAQCECELPLGTKGKEYSQPAFEVAHLAAGGMLFWAIHAY